MAYYIQKPSIIDSNITVYFDGTNKWSDDFASKAVYSTEEEANAVIANPNGKNGGFVNSTVVSE